MSTVTEERLKEIETAISDAYAWGNADMPPPEKWQDEIRRGSSVTMALVVAAEDLVAALCAERADSIMQRDALMRWREMTECDTPHAARERLGTAERKRDEWKAQAERMESERDGATELANAFITMDTEDACARLQAERECDEWKSRAERAEKIVAAWGKRHEAFREMVRSFDLGLVEGPAVYAAAKEQLRLAEEALTALGVEL